MRDDFTQPVKEVIARRVNFLCSNPSCPLATMGPHSDPEKAINKGVAAHITAASPGGKRYDATSTSEERAMAINGIWLCQNCAKLIDSDAHQFSVETLRGWKNAAEARAQRSLQDNGPLSANAPNSSVEVRVCYAGGFKKRHAHITVFNAAMTPVYLEAWYAEWDKDHGSTINQSLRCIKGSLPFRLKAQDKCEIVVDLGGKGFRGLEKVGVVTGERDRFDASKTDVAILVQDAARYSAIHEAEATAIDETELKSCDIHIGAELIDEANGQKGIAISFTNNSETPIPLTGAKIEWEYSPPRVKPIHQGNGAMVQEIGGAVDLDCLSDLTSSLGYAARVVFAVPRHLRGCLVETLLPDVPDDNIAIRIFTKTKITWIAKGEEVPFVIKAFAKSVVESFRK